MKPLSLPLFGLVLLIPLVDAEACRADLQPHWPFDRLFSESDLIVIAVPTSVMATGKIRDRGDLRLAEVDVEANVLKVVKGDQQDKITLRHYRYHDSKDWFLINPPSIVRFRTAREGVDLKGNKVGGDDPRFTAYMMFLRKDKEGKFEPISGHFHATHSIFELNSAATPWDDDK